jgi:hypothetical protein
MLAKNGGNVSMNLPPPPSVLSGPLSAPKAIFMIA